MSENTEQTKTAGEIHNDLRKKGLEKCSHLDLGYAFSDETYKGVIECIGRHYDVFGSHIKQFCVSCILCYGEGSLKYLIRRKFYGFPFLPTPCPNQAVWMVDKEKEEVTFLWTLPTPEKMAMLSEEFSFLANEARMKKWCDWFYKGAFTFWENIRTQHSISMLSEMEFNRRNREMGAKCVNDDVLGTPADSLYLPEVRIKKLEAMSNSRSHELFDNTLREAN